MGSRITKDARREAKSTARAIGLLFNEDAKAVLERGSSKSEFRSVV